MKSVLIQICLEIKNLLNQKIPRKCYFQLLLLYIFEKLARFRCPHQEHKCIQLYVPIYLEKRPQYIFYNFNQILHFHNTIFSKILGNIAKFSLKIKILAQDRKFCIIIPSKLYWFLWKIRNILQRPDGGATARQPRISQPRVELWFPRNNSCGRFCTLVQWYLSFTLNY